MRFFAAAAIALIAALPARAGSAVSEEDLKAFEKDRETVAIVDGVPISRSEYKEYLLLQAGDRMLGELIDEKLVAKEAKKLAIVVTPEDEKEWVESQLAELRGRADADEVRPRLQAIAHSYTLKERVMKARRTSDEGLRREYELRFGEKRRARHILFQVKEGPDGKPDPASLAAAKKRAEDTYADLKKGADFGEVAKKVSEDPGTRNDGGDLPEFGKSDMVPEFGNVAFKLKDGEVSEPVLSQFGWHIIQVTKIVAPAKPFDDAVKAELKTEAAKRPIDREEHERFLQELREAAKIEKKPLGAKG